MTKTQLSEAHVLAIRHSHDIRQAHDGRTSRGLFVELARGFYENPLFGDDPAELLSDLKQCAADCIGAGCEPLLRPLPGHDDQSASLAAPAEADQLEGTPNSVFVDGVECCPYCHSSNLNDAGENFGLSVWECRSCRRGCAASHQFQQFQ